MPQTLSNLFKSTWAHLLLLPTFFILCLGVWGAYGLIAMTYPEGESDNVGVLLILGVQFILLIGSVLTHLVWMIISVARTSELTTKLIMIALWIISLPVYMLLLYLSYIIGGTVLSALI
jgi:hypothetical protein